MLSAFQPQVLVELKQRDKSRIESVLVHGKITLNDAFPFEVSDEYSALAT